MSYSTFKERRDGIMCPMYCGSCFIGDVMLHSQDLRQNFFYELLGYVPCLVFCSCGDTCCTLQTRQMAQGNEKATASLPVSPSCNDLDTAAMTYRTVGQTSQQQHPAAATSEPTGKQFSYLHVIFLDFYPNLKFILHTHARKLVEKLKSENCEKDVKESYD